MVWYSHLFQFLKIHTVKGFSVVNEIKVDVFLEFPCFIYDPANVGNLISGSSSFSNPNLSIWKFSLVTILLPKEKNSGHVFRASCFPTSNILRPQYIQQRERLSPTSCRQYSSKLLAFSQ